MAPKNRITWLSVGFLCWKHPHLFIFGYVPDLVFFCLLLHILISIALLSFQASVYTISFFSFSSPLDGMNILHHLLFIYHCYRLHHSVVASTRAGTTTEFAYRCIPESSSRLVNPWMVPSSLHWEDWGHRGKSIFCSAVHLRCSKAPCGWRVKIDCGGAAGEDGAGRKQADLGGGWSISLPVMVNPWFKIALDKTVLE